MPPPRFLACDRSHSLDRKLVNEARRNERNLPRSRRAPDRVSCSRTRAKNSWLRSSAASGEYPLLRMNAYTGNQYAPHSSFRAPAESREWQPAADTIVHLVVGNRASTLALLSRDYIIIRPCSLVSVPRAADLPRKPEGCPAATVLRHASPVTSRLSFLYSTIEVL